MTATYTSQYAPVSDIETGDGSPLSVRAGRDLADSMNNAKRYAMVDKLISHISPLGVPSWNGVEDPIPTDERVVMVFAPRYLPRGFHSIRFFVGGQMMTEAGEMQISLYAMPKQYLGPAALQQSMIPNGSSYGIVTLSSDVHSIQTGTTTAVRGYADACWLMVTTTNSGALYWGKFFTLDAWPQIADAVVPE